jgi:TM2 domain-containing membrane protein YozV
MFSMSKSNMIYPKKSPPSKWLILLTAVFPGLTQIVLGQVAKGFLYLLLVILLGFLAMFVPVARAFPYLMYGLCIGDAWGAITSLQQNKPIGKWRSAIIKEKDEN